MNKTNIIILSLFWVIQSGCISDSGQKNKGNQMDFKTVDKMLYPMSIDPNGKHVFGGKATHKGSTPSNTNVPLHKLLSIDLSDSKIPFSVEGLKKLPLYYPLKYGIGGPSIQYSVLSENEIDIIYMSDPQPDPEDEAYVQVESFPEVRLKTDSPVINDDDLSWFTISLGGSETLDHQADYCENPNCANYHKEPDVELIACVPPFPIPGKEDLWYEFEGAYLLFYFWYCNGCSTIIASNRCT